LGGDVDFCEPPGGQSDDGRHDQELAAFYWATLNVKVRTLVTEFDPGAAPGLERDRARIGRLPPLDLHRLEELIRVSSGEETEPR
jgi:hypothetical protein